MIFNYFKYVSPTWYFNLKPKQDHSYFPTLDQIKEQAPKFELDFNFISEEARARDAAYRAFQMGYISNLKNENGVDIWKGNKIISTKDEYRFLKKNFSPFWVLYTLILRILSFHNPFKELYGFVFSKNVKREVYAKKSLSHTAYKSFESELIKSSPLVSVVIPTLNRYTYLKDVFRDLENQSYSNFEVIVVDQTEPFDESVYQGWDLDLKYWYQEEKALWKARNEAIQSAKGDYILLYDDDSLIENDWIEQHLKTLDYFNADISSGVSLSMIGAKIPEHYAYFRWSDQLDTGNVLIKREVFNQIGLFDTKFEKQRMGDGEFGLRTYLAGYRNVSNPYAKRVHLKVGTGGLRQMGSWDGWRPKKFFGPRPVPSILYLFRKYHGDSAARWALLKNAPPSIIPYKLKGNKVALLIGIVNSVFLLPIIVLQVWSSWRKASKMLIN